MTRTRHQQGRNEQLTPTGKRRCSNQPKITAEIVDLSILTQVGQKTARQPILRAGIAERKVISSECAEERRQITMVVMVKTETQEPHLYHDLPVHICLC